MNVTVDRPLPRPLHPVHAVLLAGMTVLLLGALLADIAYAASYQIQWKNFASWLLVGGLVLGGPTLLWALVGLFRAGRGRFVYFVLVLAAWIAALVNTLVHAEDAWSSMPAALILSVIGGALATLATVLGFSTLRLRVLP